MLCCLFCVHVGFVYYAGGEAVVIQWAWVFFSTVASVLLCSVVVRDFLAMVVNDTGHVWQAAVASMFLLKTGWRLGFMGNAS